MTPNSNYDLSVRQGETVVRHLVLQDDLGELNLAGFTARLQARASMEDDVALIDLDSGLLGGIILGARSLGSIDFTIDETETANLPVGRDGVYELVIYSPDSTATPILWGKFRVVAAVVR